MIDTLIQCLTAIFLGLLQGVTELLPISSSSHVLLGADLCSFHAFDHKAFASMIQLGSAIALLFRMKQPFIALGVGLAKKEAAAQSLLISIALSLVPAVIVGIFFHSFIRTTLYGHNTVAVALMIGGLILLLINPLSACTSKTLPTKAGAFLIGCFQTLAFIPGASRLGSTLVGGIISGLSRASAIHFSFLIAIPTLLGGSVFDVLKIYPQLSLENVGFLCLGWIAAFFTTYKLFPVFIRFLTEKGFFAVGWYRIALGIFFFLR